MITKLDISKLERSSTMLDEDKFWDIIHESIEKSTNQKQQKNYLKRLLFKLSAIELIGFRLRTDKFLFDSYTSEIWCAGYLMNGGCGDDGFEYFRCWLISRGKKTYYETLRNPDYLVKELIEGEIEYEFESFWYVANDVFEDRTQKNLYDYRDLDKFKTVEANYIVPEFTWEEDDNDSMRKICPQLFERLWDEKK